MSEVPQLTTPDVQQAPLPNVHFDAAATIDDFGGGQSLESMGRATQGVAQTAQDIAGQEKQQADQIVNLSNASKFQDQMNQAQIQIGLMKGQDALKAPDVAQQLYSQAVQSVSAGVNNDAQKAMFARTSAEGLEQLNKFTQQHVSTQIQSFADNETQSYLNTSRPAAGLNATDDDRVQFELDNQTAVTQDYAARKGIPQNSQQYQDLLPANLSTTNRAVIQARLDKDSPDNVEQAKAYFDDHKDQLTAQDSLTMSKAIDSAETVTLGMKIWNQVKDMTLSDGMPDEAKMEATIMGNPDLSDARKIEITQFVKARDRERILQTHMEDADNDNQFYNALTQARKQGAPLQDALKLAPQYANDDYDQDAKEGVIRQKYAPPSQSDPATYINLWQKVQDGTIARADIDQANQKGLINTSDWQSLRKEYYRSTTEGLDPQDKLIDDRVKSLAQSTIGSDKDKMSQFMYVYHTQSQDQDATQKWKTANDLLGPNPQSHWYNFAPSKQYQVDAQRYDAQNLAWGKVHQDVGSAQTTATGQGVINSNTNRPSWGLGDVDAFAVQFGGYNNIKTGTPVNNAMQSIIKRGQLVTPANVNALLQKYPDGKY